MTLNQARRRNAKLYPIYKMFSWDTLFYYSIEFLFLTMTKGLTPSQVLIANGLYIVFKLFMNIPAVMICDRIGKRNTNILGGIFLVIRLFIFIKMPGMLSIILGYFVSAVGWSMRGLTESNLLYDSVATRGGDGLYTKLEAKGASWYYLMDGITSLMAGYLFVANNYLPIYICLGFTICSLILSLFFKEIYPPEKDKRKKLSTFLEEYGHDLKSSMKFISHSRRMKAYLLFGGIFIGIITIYDTYKSDLLIDIGISEEQFSMIYAILSMIAGFSVNLITTLEKKFKNRILTFLSLTYVLSFLLVALIVINFTGPMMISFVLLLYCIVKMVEGNWYVLEPKYLKNFSQPEMRGKISFAYEIVNSIIASTMSILGSLLLKVVPIKSAFLIITLILLGILILVLDYMRTRFGLKLEQYTKEDIEFIE